MRANGTHPDNSRQRSDVGDLFDRWEEAADAF